VGGDDIRTLCYLLDLAARSIGNAVQKVEHAEGRGRLKVLQIEDNGAAIQKIIGNITYLGEGFGMNDLQLDVAVLVIGYALDSGLRLLSYGCLGSGRLLCGRLVKALEGDLLLLSGLFL
jgi:hypothetical protein